MISPLVPTSTAIVPIPRFPITIRLGTLDDLPFIDALQNKHHKMVGYMWTKQLEGKISLGHVLVAEEMPTADNADSTDKNLYPSSSASSALSAVETRLGYCIGNDQYFKRDDVGIIYQMNVVPGRQRSLIGATLVKAMFDRAAYGCRLFCCWCAQDIEANYFWESLGFVPLAFRAGSRKKRRVHIFWQRRIRAGDVTTPYWFPSQTSGGSIREDRLVLPIPPGMRWSDEMPRVLPGEQLPVVSSQLPDKKKRAESSLVTGHQQLATISKGGLRFAVPDETLPAVKRKRGPKPRVKNDPELIAATRELRDRWQEAVNAGQYLPLARGKYEMGRAMPATQMQQGLLMIEPKPIAA